MRRPAKAPLAPALLGLWLLPVAARALNCFVSVVNPVFSGPVVQLRPGDIDGQGFITVRCDPLADPAVSLPVNGVVTATIRLGPGNSGSYRQRRGGSPAYPGPTYNLYVDSGRQATSVFGDGMTDGTQSASCTMTFTPGTALLTPARASSAPQSCMVPFFGRIPGGQNPDALIRRYDDTVPVTVTYP